MNWIFGSKVKTRTVSEKPGESPESNGSAYLLGPFNLRVLTMEYIKGMRITDKAVLLDAGIDCSDLGVRLAQILLRQVLEDSTTRIHIRAI